MGKRRKPRRRKASKPRRTSSRTRRRMHRAAAAKLPSLPPTATAPEYYLEPIDRAILAEFVRDPSLSDTKVAQILKIDRETLARHKRTPAFQRALRDVYLPTEQIAKRLVRQALARYPSLIAHEDGRVAVAAVTSATKHLWPDTLKVTGEDGGAVKVEVPTVAEFLKRLAQTKRAKP